MNKKMQVFMDIVLLSYCSGSKPMHKSLCLNIVNIRSCIDELLGIGQV